MDFDGGGFLKRKLYAGYGANVNKDGMAERCSDAEVYGTGFIEGYRLEFRKVATIEKSDDDKVPVVVWRISDDDEAQLDKFEGVANGLYRKDVLNVTLNSGEIAEAMVYILEKDLPKTPPVKVYLNKIKEGYQQFGLDLDYLCEALKWSRGGIASEEK